MNAGSDFGLALERAQAVANAVQAPRWLYRCNWIWWIADAPPLVYRSWKVDPE